MKGTIETLARLAFGQTILVRKGRKDTPITLDQFKDMTLDQIGEYLESCSFLLLQEAPADLEVHMYGVREGDVWWDSSGGSRTLLYYRNERDGWDTAAGDRVKESDLRKLRYRFGVKR